MAWGEATDEDGPPGRSSTTSPSAGIRELLGLDQLELAITGAAPIPAELLAWYRAIGVPLSEIYGMSESTGPMTWAPYKVKPGTVGPAVPGSEVAHRRGRRGASAGAATCSSATSTSPEKTAEALDDDGWLHTGDIGELDEDGYLQIVDRKKELIITAGGKNISPANLEAALKMIPLVGQACAIGDQRPFVSALVVLDPDTAPAWAKQHGHRRSPTSPTLAEQPRGAGRDRARAWPR